MGFRLGWFGKFGGISWGPRGGFRGMVWGGGRRSGCVVAVLGLLSILGGSIYAMAILLLSLQR